MSEEQVEKTLQVVAIGHGSAGEPPPCDVCGRTMPAIRQGAIECHHDGTYTPLLSLADGNELAAWRGLGADMLSDVGIGTMGARATLVERLRALVKATPKGD